jgi:hypothetical protein
MRSIFVKIEENTAMSIRRWQDRPACPLGSDDGLPDRLRDKGGPDPQPRRCNACMTKQSRIARWYSGRAAVFLPGSR